MFGMEEHSVVDMPQFLVPEFMGRALYGIFTIVMVIVLLNMLIAMITNSFQKIEVRELRTTQARGKKREREGKEQDARSQEIALSPLLPCFETGDKFSSQALNFLVCRLRVLMMLLFLSDTSLALIPH